MDGTINNFANYYSSAESNREVYSKDAGDFANSGEIDKYMPKIMEMIMQSHNLASNSFPSGMPNSDQLQNSSGKIPPMPENGTMSSVANAVPSGVSGMPFTGVPTGIPVQMPSFNNPDSNVSGKTKRHMPEQKVLTEPCTINQPMNSSLRDSFSIGTFYFLK